MNATDLDIYLPRYIAICGNPKSGKSEVQKILNRAYGVQPVDDGEPLREFAIRNLGLSYEDAYTQEGKLRSTTICGEEWQNRKVLGELGNALEKTFGKHIMPFMAVQATKRLGHARAFSFGSVRRDQGLFYKQAGCALVLEVANPSAGPSNYEFDQFDRSAVDITIQNDALFRGFTRERALEDLEMKVRAAIDGWCLVQKAAH